MNQQKETTDKTKKTRISSLKKMKSQEKALGYVFASPWLIGLFLFGAFPFLASLFISFTTYNMVGKPKFIGFVNYKILLFSDDLFWKSLYNTIYHVVIAVPLGIVVGVVLALLLNTKIKGMSLYRTLYYLPNVVSIVAMSLLWLWLFQPSFGLVNQVLDPFYKLFHMEPLGWYKDASISKLTLIIMGLWTAGGSMVIYLAQLQDIPNELYEAADVDGANAMQKIFKITLPLMTPSIFFNFIMGLIGGFQVFTTAYIMTGGGPSKSTYYYSYYLFDKMIYDNAMGSASAMAWILLVITLIITILALSLNKYVFYLGDQEQGK